ncbi:TPA: restriction endonuclease subunit S [Escherichia coli O146]
MSEMSYLEKLLDGVEVEWLPLSDLARIRNGKDHKSLSEGEFPVYGSGGIMRYVDTYAYNKPSVLIPRKGSLGNLFFVNVPFWTVDTIFYTEIDEAQIRPKYLYYFLTTVGLGEMNQAGGVPSQTQSVLNKLKIPIPCPDNPEKSLAIQSEIVRILDKFSALTAELTAELNMRKKQYNYYRDQLLSFKEGEVEWKTLGEVAKIQRGASPRPIVNYLTEQGNGIPWIKIGDTIPGSKYIDKTLQKITVEGAQKSRILNPGDFVISNSMSFGRPYILRITGAIHDGWASISNFGEKLNADYLYHYLSSKKVKNYWESKINSGSVSNLNADIIKTLPVPLPDKQKQERISALLDKFDTLTNSITEGLPREIELRRKQYEYYRDLLFSFPKPETASN